MNHARPLTGLVLALALATAGTGRAESASEPVSTNEATPRESTEIVWEGDRLEREDLVRRVLERNPSIATARAAWRAATERVPQARSLMDPIASVTTAPLSYFGDGRIGYGASLSQAIPYPGTLFLRGEQAEAEARVLELDLETVRLDLALEAAELFDRYRFFHRALEINEEHLDLLASFQEIATGRYAAGLVPQQAPIQAEVETAHLRHREVELRSEIRMVTARMNALLHRGVDEALPPPAPIDGPPPPPPQNPGAMFAEALADRPELAARRAELEARRTGVELERLELKPDFEAMTSFSSMWAMSDHRWMVGVGIRIPFWKERIRAGIAEAQARVDESESSLASLEDELEADVEMALVRLREAIHVAHLYEARVFPATRDQISAARSGFETGQVSMLDLIEAERSLRTAKLEYEQAVTGAWLALARLERALGRLPALDRPDETSTTHPHTPSEPEIER